MKRYNPKEIEPKWQAWWQDNNTYQANLHSDKPKYIAMSMFNYPSGAGIHIGHALNYTISDVLARAKRQQGYESYHPVGWDSFGMPAENHAIKEGISPQESMARIIPNYHKQYQAMGWSNDWSKEIAAHDPDYYRWTQWIFSEVYRAGLVYQDSRQQWWCDKCQTVLANEQVLDDKCWRHDGKDDPVVEKREVKQWFFRITDYADELLEATDSLDWTDSVKTAQKNWIGKSKGAEIEFEVDDRKDTLTVFTTRPDTLYGATFMVLAPEHELVSAITTSDQQAEVEAYQKQAAKKSEVERQANKDKTGVFTGAYAINPVNGAKVPVWIADYVLSGYGTGAIMAVPAHDERDYEFAQKFDLPIKYVFAEDFGQPLENAEDVQGSVVIVYDESTKKFLGVTTGTNDGLWLNGGGSENDESFEQTAIRELKEETGFKKYKSVHTLGQPVFSYYFNDVKKKAKRSYGQGFLFVVNKQDQDQANLEEHEQGFKHDWYDFQELVDGVSKVGGGVEHWLEMLARAKAVVDGTYQDQAVLGEGTLINSEKYDGLSTSSAREQIVADLAKKGVAKEKIIYKIRDWSVSRQRYWGAPIPIVYCQKCGPVLLPDEQLPVVLPELEDFAPSGDGRSALARASDWVTTTCPDCGGHAERETDTLDTYVCSSWYMLRYLDPSNSKQIFDSQQANKWMPIDFYNGADHATAHLIYARFIARFFHKQGMLDNPEPFKKFLFNGKVTAHDGTMFSKSKGNGVDPLEIIDAGYGADALRTYLMFASPLELWTRWDEQGVPGSFRFLNRAYTLVQEYQDKAARYEERGSTGGTTDISKQLNRIVHGTIHKVTHDIEELKYNTAIASLMACVNELYKLKEQDSFEAKDWQFSLEALTMLIAPFAPHTAEDMWHDLGHNDSVQVDHWPVHDDAYLVADTITIGVSVNGKVRGEVEVAADASEADVLAAAKQLENVAKYVANGTKKEIYVPGRLVNFVV